MSTISENEGTEEVQCDHDGHRVRCLGGDYCGRCDTLVPSTGRGYRVSECPHTKQIYTDGQLPHCERCGEEQECDHPQPDHTGWCWNCQSQVGTELTE